MLHTMKLQPAPYEKIVAGTKQIEMRLWDKKRRTIAPYDAITFTNMQTGGSYTTLVLKLHRAKTFEQLYELCGAEALGGGCPQDLLTYYTPEQIKKWGVVGIALYNPSQERGEYAQSNELKQVDELIENYFENGEFERCFQEMRKLAKKKVAPALFQVGYMYANGLGVAQNSKKAREYMIKALQLGDPYAADGLIELELSQQEE